MSDYRRKSINCIIAASIMAILAVFCNLADNYPAMLVFVVISAGFAAIAIILLDYAAYLDEIREIPDD